MSCPIQKPEDFFKKVQADLLIVKEGGQPFNLRNYIGQVYDEVTNAIKEDPSLEGKAADIVKNLPKTVAMAAGSSIPLFGYLAANGLDFIELAKLTETFGSITPQAGETMGDAVSRVLSDVVLQSKPKPDIAAINAAVEQVVTFQEAGLTNDYVALIKAAVTYEAKPFTVLSTMMNSEMTYTDPVTNKPSEKEDISKRRYTGFISHIASSIPYANTVDGKVYLPGTSVPIYLTTKWMGMLPADSIYERFGSQEYQENFDKVQVITNSLGEPLFFDDNYNITSEQKGKAIYYRFRKQQTKYKGELRQTYQSIEEATKSHLKRYIYNKELQGQTVTDEEISAEEILFKDRYASEVALAQKIDNYINQNTKEHFIVNEITGVSEGFIDTKIQKVTPIRDINLDGQPFIIRTVEVRQVNRVANAELVLRNNRTVDLFNYGVPAKYVDLIASTLVEDTYYQNDPESESIKTNERLKLIKNFIYTMPNEFTVTKVEDDQYNVTLGTTGRQTLTKEQTIAAIKNYLTTPARNNKKVILNIDKKKLVDPTQFFDYTLQDDGSGRYAIVPTKLEYSEWIKDNFSVQAGLDAEGKIRGKNPYITFSIKADQNIKIGEQPAVETSNIDFGAIPDFFSPADDSIEDEDDLFNQIKRKGLEKAFAQKVLNKNEFASEEEFKEQVELVEEWYNQTGLNKHFKINVLFNVVNSKAVATWTRNAINLYAGSDKIDIFHEAYHGFTQKFLTRDQRNRLYKELAVNKATEKFTTYKGQTKTFGEATERELDEYLAEEFRSYMISNGKMEIERRAARSIFKKIFDFIQKLFRRGATYKDVLTYDTSLPLINDIFQKLALGDISKYTADNANVSSEILEKSIISATGDAVLNDSETDMVMLSANSIISTLIDKLNADSNTSAYTQKLLLDSRKETYKFIRNSFVKRLNTIANEYKAIKDLNLDASNPRYDEYQMKLATLEHQIYILKTTIDNFGDVDNMSETYGFVKHYEDNGSFLAYQKMLDQEDDLDETVFVAEKNKTYDLTGNENTIYEQAHARTIYLVESLLQPKYNSKTQKYEDPKVNTKTGETEYEYEKDYLGFPKLVDFDYVWNKLSQVLDNLDPSESVFRSQLASQAGDFPFLFQLLKKLGDPETRNPWVSKMWASFVTDFNYIRTPIEALTIELIGTKTEDNKKETFTSAGATFGVASSSSKAAARDWDDYFQQVKNHPYIKESVGAPNQLDVQAVLDEFQNNYLGREIEFFHALGINIINKPQVRERLQSNGRFNTGRVKDFLNNLEFLIENNVKFVSSIDAVVNPKQKDGKSLATIYSNIQGLHLKYTEDRSDFMALRPDGNAQSEFMRNSTLTVKIRGLNSFDTYGETVAQPHLSEFDYRRNPWVKRLVLMNDLFNFNSIEGERKRASAFVDTKARLDITLLGGTAVIKDGIGEGLANIDLDDYSKIQQDFITVILKGVSEGTRSAGKPTSVILKSNTRKFYVSPADFISNSAVKGRGLDKVVQIFIGYAAAELDRINWLKENPNSPEALANDGKNTFYDRGTVFTLFDDIFTDATKDKLYGLSGESLDVLMGDIAFRESEEGGDIADNVIKDIRSYLIRQYSNTQNALIGDIAKLYPNENPFIDPNVINIVRNEALSNGIRSEVSEQDAYQAALLAYVTNSLIHNIETTVIIHGDAAQFNNASDEFHKRNAPAQSSGKFPILSKERLDYLNDFLSKPYVDSPWFADYTYNGVKYAGVEPTFIKPFSQQATFAVFKEAKIKSIYYNMILNSILGDDMAALEALDMYKDASEEEQAALREQLTAEITEMVDEAYGNMKEGDGQGWAAFDFYRGLCDQLNQWSPEQEALYKKILKKEYVTESKSDLLQIFPILKMQYDGPLAGTGLPLNALLKFEIFPLIPNVIEGTELNVLHNKMVEQNMDIATYESGSKLMHFTNNGKTDLFYSDIENRELALVDENYRFTPNTLFLQYFKKQAEISDKYKGKTNLATQMRKAIINNMDEYGVPVDFKFDGEPVDRIKAWSELTKDQKEKESPKYVAVNRYKKALLSLVAANTEKLYKKFGVLDEDGNKTNNAKGMVEFLRNQLAVLGLPSHIINDISYDPKTGKINSDLSLSFGADDIEKLLMSMINKSLIKPKIKGDQLVQVSNSGFTRNYAEKKLRYATEEERLKYLGTGDLPFYNITEDGHFTKAGAKMGINGDFKKLLMMEETTQRVAESEVPITRLQALNQLIREESWLAKYEDLITIVTVRIPTAKENFIEYLQIYEFLDENAGPIIVLPMEVVGKSGTDFDTDKQVSYFPNISFQREFDKNYIEEMKTLSPDLKLDIKYLNKILDLVEEDGIASLKPKQKQVYAVAKAALTEKVYMADKGMRGVENEFLNSVKGLLDLMSYSDFVRPVTTQTALPIAKKYEQHVMTYNHKLRKDGTIGKTTSPTRIIEILHNIKKLSENSVGFQSLGIGAVSITGDAMMNQANLYLNREYKTEGKSSQKRMFTIEFDHNYLMMDGIPVVSLAALRGKNNYKKIVNQLEELLNGWVDVEKDAWIFYLNGVKTVAPVMIAMLQAGVALEDVAAFVNQPIIREYVRRMSILKSPFAFLSNIAPENANFFRIKSRKDMLISENAKNTLDYPIDLLKALELEPLSIDPKSGTKESSGKYNLGNLTYTFGRELIDNYNTESLFNKDTLNKKIINKSTEYGPEDYAVLFHFFEMEDVGKALAELKRNTNFDVKKESRLFATMQKDLLAKGMLEDARFNPEGLDHMINNSVISSFRIADVAKDLIGGLFGVREDKDFNDILIAEWSSIKSIDKNTYDDMEVTLNELKNQYVQFLLQNYLNDVDIDTIKEFKGLAVNNKLPVAEAPGLKSFGAYVLNGILYISKEAIKNNYATLVANHQDVSNEQVRTAKIDSQLFSTEKEYQNFILNREILRSITDVDQLITTPEFKTRLIQKKKELRAQNSLTLNAPLEVKQLITDGSPGIGRLTMDLADRFGYQLDGYTGTGENLNDLAGFNIKGTDPKNVLRLNIELADACVIYGVADAAKTKRAIEIINSRKIPYLLNPSAQQLRTFLSQGAHKKVNIISAAAATANELEQLNKVLGPALIPAEKEGAAAMREVYEEILRDRALDQVFNISKLFRGIPNGEASYAMQFEALKLKYPALQEMYPLVDLLRASAIGKGLFSGANVLILKTRRPSKPLKEKLYQNFKELSNPTSIRLNIPYQEKEAIAKFFSRLPTVVLLATGISGKGENALWQFVDKGNLNPVLEEAVQAASGKTKKNIIREYITRFQQANSKSSFKSRRQFRSYMVDGTFNKMGAQTNSKATGIKESAVTFSAGNKYSINNLVTADLKKVFASQEEGNIFLYNGTTNPAWSLSTFNNVAGILNDVGTDNLIPMRTYNMVYNNDASFTDASYDTNVMMINEDIARIKNKIQELVDKGVRRESIRIFTPKTGLGQGMIGASDFTGGAMNKIKAKGTKTFLYLSEALAQLGVVNTNSDTVLKTDEPDVKSAVNITDDMVLDIIEQRTCFKS